uniref:TIR domain-containing protein n=2 Tax=Periophthalmus magnuspinnatus TaxID=409849 RepID=A0A3B3ZUP3_9GOBI
YGPTAKQNTRENCLCLTGGRLHLTPQSSSLFSFLFLLLLPWPSCLYSFKKCSVNIDDQSLFKCTQKQLTNIPTDIPKSATDINLARNDIHIIRQTDLTGFYKLETLSLEMNKISHIEDGAFSDLSALTFLYLSFNQLTNLTDHMFKGLSNLSTLAIDTNQIHSISKFAFKPLNKLHTLRLTYNSLVSSDVAKILMHSLAGNDLTVFEPENCPFLLTSMTEPVIEWDVSDKDIFRSLSKLYLATTSFDIQSYQLLFKLVDSVDDLYLSGIGRLFDKGLLDFACNISSLQKLYLDLNNISILNDSLLQSCANLTYLDLAYNSLTDLTEASLQMLTQLTDLLLNDNHLSRIPVAIRNMTTLKYLSFTNNNIKELQCSDFLNLSSLTKLSLSNNVISKISSCVFRNLPNLENLNIFQNRLAQLDGCFDGTLMKLNSLDVSENSIGWLQRGTFHNMSSLTRLLLARSGVPTVEAGAFEGLYNLTDLDLSTNSFLKEAFADLPRLQRLVLSLHSLLPGPLSTTDSFNLSSLQSLEVKVTLRVCFPRPQDVLKGLGNLTTLKSSTFFCQTPHQDTFIYTPHLEELHIKSGDEFDASPELFHPLKELKILDLTNNRVKSVEFLSNANLIRLEVLRVNLNEIKVVNETVFRALPSLKYLDLSDNPFACNCSNAGFISWAIRNKQVQVVNAYQYRCSSPPTEEGHFLLDFNVQLCWEFTGFLCFISTSALVLVTLLSSFTYHFLRWQLVYGFYLLLAFLYDSKKKRQGCPDIYDAFVSYNVHDEDWVYGELLPELEGVQGWRLCLHHRDFQPGKPIIENITDAIYSSRKTLCVISRRYLQSEWCSREIQMASYRLFDEQKDVLILLFLEEISSNQLSPFYRMRKLVKSRTYLSWTQAQSHKGLFWENVRRALECGNEPTDNHNLLTANVY